LAASILATIGIIGGVDGFGYFTLLLLTAVPGIPLGFALFGRRHFVSLVTGGALGDVITSLAGGGVCFFGHPSTWAVVDAWVVVTLASWAVARSIRSPVVTLPRWTSAHGAALMLLLLLVPALVARPFAKLGSVDRDGNHLYRAYFVADF